MSCCHRLTKQRLSLLQENEGFLNPQRGPDGKFLPVEGLTPMDESFIGGFFPQASIRAGSPMPPELPPKDDIYKHSAFPSSQTSSTITTGQLTTMTAVERSKILRIARMDPHLQVSASHLTQHNLAERLSSSWLDPCSSASHVRHSSVLV